MVNLKEVLEFIQNADQSEIKAIKNAVAIKRSELAYDAKVSFRVGDIVGIDHKKIDPKQNFRVIKINSKNIKVQASDVADGRVGGQYTVSPSLLVKK
jgi:hypothetical protein|tara:strand:- start:49 stop:339 length:291 start_codon:yes stop_codon:yes gene_type:complete